MSARIRKERERLEGLVARHQVSITKLQAVCKHNNRTPAKCLDCAAVLPCAHPNVTKKHGKNTGNYDPTADWYWTDFKCPDCGKFWVEDGSK